MHKASKSSSCPGIVVYREIVTGSWLDVSEVAVPEADALLSDTADELVVVNVVDVLSSPPPVDVDTPQADAVNAIAAVSVTDKIFGAKAFFILTLLNKVLLILTFSELFPCHTPLYGNLVTFSRKCKKILSPEKAL